MFTLSSLPLALAVLAARDVAAQATVTSTQNVQLPTSKPVSAYEVPANFPSVGFEHAFLPGYDNEFSDNMIAELGARLGEKPLIRIGGTSGDIFKYNPKQTEPADCLANDDVNNCTSADHFILGPHWFDALRNRFKDAQFSIQAPLDAKKDSHAAINKTNVLAFMREVYKVLDASRIDAIALGNEINFFEIDAADAVQDSLQAAGYLTASDIPIGEGKIWEILDTASEGTQGSIPAPYTPKGVFNAGINEDGRVKYLAEHYYQFNGKDGTVQDHLLNHAELVEQFAKYQPHINYTRGVEKVGYIFSETGGPLGVSKEEFALFANTLWAVNFMLYSMSHGVQRVSLVQRPVAKRSLWIPSAGLSTPGPRVQAPWYAMPFVADFLGKSVSGPRGVAHLPLDTNFITAYAMYEGDQISKVALVNLRNFAGQESRKAVKVRLQGLGGVEEVRIGRLHAPEGTAAGGMDVNKKEIKWQDQEWRFDVGMGKVSGEMMQKTLKVTGGVVEVVIPDSEAIIVYFKQA
ncbi:hypothetical protein N0V90_005525 [Kalmusia sp. IMI 367209]|nr:hypothetical protein N0V90_005525 [Kalmusia sp. IMI 367209]